jgi:diaminopimelate decarboxylase
VHTTNFTNARTVQGVDLLEVCKEFGTPVYVYDADKIVRQIHKMRSAFAGVNFKIKYAVKSLPNLSVLKLMKSQGLELDAVSIQEVQLGLRAGFAPEEILYTPNCVSFEEIQQAIALGVGINIDNLPQLEQFGKTYGNTVPCCIRLNPNIFAGGNTKISVGHIDSKFGISTHQSKDILAIVENYNLNINGLHVHTGSDIVDAEVFLLGAQVIFDAAEHFSNLQFIDFGSGFKVPYTEEDAATNLTTLGESMKEAFRAFCQHYGRDLELWFEPGKFLVSEAGQLLVKTNVVKTTPATIFVGVNSGMNHLIRPMMYDAYHHMENISHQEGPRRTYTVVGYICETDTLGSERTLHEVREGDIIAIHNAGAYGFSMASNYNSRLRPAEVLIINGEAKLIRERETLDDLLRHQIVIDI